MNVGIVGLGHLGKIHLKLLGEIPQYTIKAIYDIDKQVIANLTYQKDVTICDNYDELLQLCEVVLIITPTSTHFELASKAIKKGKHVFIEKPATDNPDDTKILINLAKEAGVIVQVGHVERFNPAFTAAKDYFENPSFIEIERLACYNSRGTDVSVVLDLMIHDIDIILSVVKANIRKISASGVAVVSDTPDIANARLEFDNGCVANITSSRISLKNMRKSRFFQRDAYISIDFLEKTSEIVQMAEDDGNDPFALSLELGNGKSKKKIIYNKLEVEPLNAIKEELSSFAQAINQDTKTKVSLSDGFKALDVAYQIIEKIDAKTIPFATK